MYTLTQVLQTNGGASYQRPLHQRASAHDYSHCRTYVYHMYAFVLYWYVRQRPRTSASIYVCMCCDTRVGPSHNSGRKISAAVHPPSGRKLVDQRSLYTNRARLRTTIHMSASRALVSCASVMYLYIRKRFCTSASICVFSIDGCALVRMHVTQLQLIVQHNEGNVLVIAYCTEIFSVLHPRACAHDHPHDHMYGYHMR